MILIFIKQSEISKIRNIYLETIRSEIILKLGDKSFSFFYHGKLYLWDVYFLDRVALYLVYMDFFVFFSFLFKNYLV